MSLGDTVVVRPVVHIVDDDEGLGRALANLLTSSGIQVAIFTSPAAFLEAFGPHDCGCILLDIRFPGSSGLDFQDQLRAAGVALPVILMTGHADVPTSIRGMKGGAIDLLLKPFDDDELLAAVEGALERDAERCAREALFGDMAGRYGTLTSREREVMSLVVRGLMNKQVAGELNLSEITVKVHRGTMMRKMKLRTVADLVRAAEALKALEIDSEVGLTSA